MADDEAYVRAHLEQKGFSVVAEASDGEIAGFFIIKYPDKDDNLGTYLGFDDRQLSQVAVMDSAAVDTAFREMDFRAECWKLQKTCWIRTDLYI